MIFVMYLPCIVHTTVAKTWNVCTYYTVILPEFMMLYICLFRAIVYVSHGFGEHMGRYEELGQHLATSGILMFGHDHGQLNNVLTRIII